MSLSLVLASLLAAKAEVSQSLALVMLFAAKVEVSQQPTCSGLVNLGNPSAVTATWAFDHLSVSSVDPLRCVVVTDKPTFMLNLASLPPNAVLSVQPLGSGYTSTAQVNGSTVSTTWPLSAPATETWQLKIDPRNGKGPVLVPIEIQRPA